MIKLDVRKFCTESTTNADARSVCGSYPSCYDLSRLTSLLYSDSLYLKKIYFTDNRNCVLSPNVMGGTQKAVSIRPWLVLIRIVFLSVEMEKMQENIMRRFTEGGGGMATARIEEDTTGDDESVSACILSCQTRLSSVSHCVRPAAQSLNEVD